MNRVNFYLLGSLAIIFAAAIVMLPSRASSSRPLSKVLTAPSIPDSIQKIFENSCTDCHGEGGNGMALAHVNFSKWDTYKPDKQADKAKAICKVLTKGSMPPKGFRKAHPDAIPTPANVSSVCKWAGSFNK